MVFLAALDSRATLCDGDVESPCSTVSGAAPAFSTGGVIDRPWNLEEMSSMTNQWMP